MYELYPVGVTTKNVRATAEGQDKAEGRRDDDLDDTVLRYMYKRAVRCKMLVWQLRGRRTCA